MKILYIIKDLEVGGAQRLVSDLLPLIKRAHEVDLLLFKMEDNAFTRKVREAGIRIICMPTSLRSPGSLIRLRKVLRQYDVIHVHLFPELYVVALAAMCTKIPLVFTEHSTSNRRRSKWYLRPLEQWVYRRYKRIVAISEQTRDALMQWVQAKPDDKRFVVVENGIDTKAFRRDNESTGQRINLSTCQIIMVSRFVEAKDQDTVIKAMQHLDEQFHLCFVGDGDRMRVCQQLVETLGLQERVTFLGQRSDIPELVREADIGVQSSHWEGFGLTAVELMAAGLPVVATDVPGLKQVVEGAGLLFAVGDEVDLVKKIKALTSDADYYNKVSAQCAQRASQYDISITAERYMKVYEELI